MTTNIRHQVQVTQHPTVLPQQKYQYFDICDHLPCWPYKIFASWSSLHTYILTGKYSLFYAASKGRNKNSKQNKLFPFVFQINSIKLDINLWNKLINLNLWFGSLEAVTIISLLTSMNPLLMQVSSISGSK